MYSICVPASSAREDAERRLGLIQQQDTRRREVGQTSFFTYQRLSLRLSSGEMSIVLLDLSFLFSGWCGSDRVALTTICDKDAEQDLGRTNIGQPRHRFVQKERTGDDCGHGVKIDIIGGGDSAETLDGQCSQGEATE